MTQETDDQIFSLTEAGEYAHIGRQAIWAAIKKNVLKAEKVPVGTVFRWMIKRSDLDDYRANKYNSDRRKVNGEKIFDLEGDRWGVMHASKILTVLLKRSYSPTRLYYLLRTGQLRASRMGKCWIIKKADLIDLYMKESHQNEEQLQMI